MYTVYSSIAFLWAIVLVSVSIVSFSCLKVNSSGKRKGFTGFDIAVISFFIAMGFFNFTFRLLSWKQQFALSGLNASFGCFRLSR